MQSSWLAPQAGPAPAGTTCSRALWSVFSAAAGNNPIMLIGTKVDLLPAGSKPDEIAEWLRTFAAFKRISAVSVHLVSWQWWWGVGGGAAG